MTGTIIADGVTNELRRLAGFVANRPVEHYPAGTCVAFPDDADRVCGKQADVLCSRHFAVAKARAAHVVATIRAVHGTSR